jgi:AraC-like DNA-binding protein
MNDSNNTEKQFLNHVTGIIEANLHKEQFGVSELARHMNISRTTLHRKIKANAKTSVSQFICQVRLKKAFELLKENSSTISETAYDCGFHSVTYFNKCFRDYFGYPPGETDKHIETEKSEDEIRIDQIKKKNKWLHPTPILLLLLFVVLLTMVIFYFTIKSVGKTNQKSQSLCYLSSTIAPILLMFILLTG